VYILKWPNGVAPFTILECDRSGELCTSELNPPFKIQKPPDGGFWSSSVTILRFSRSFFVCGVPDKQAESDLVNNVSKVVDDIQRSCVSTAGHVAKEVTNRVN